MGEVETPRSGRRWKYAKLSIVPILLIAGVALILLGYDWRSLIVDQGFKGYAFYIGFLIVLPLLGFPISAFYVFSGITFSPWVGLGVTSTGLFLNMIAGYWVGRCYLHEPISAYLHKKEKTKRWLHTKNLIRLTVLVRAVPGVPYFMQNYILGLVKAPFWMYLFVSWSIQSMFCAGTIFLTSSGKHFRDASNALPLALIGIVFFVLIWYLKHKLTQNIPSDVDSDKSNNL